MRQTSASSPDPAAKIITPIAWSPEIALAPPRYRDSNLLEALRRRASSRLSRYFMRARRRLVNARPMVSFTFDDAAASAHAIGATMVEKAGGRGVYYIATGLVGRRTTHYSIVERSQVRELHARGHEIGLHGHSHCAVGWLKPQALHDELERNCDELAKIDSRIEALNFAYPFGLVAVERKRALAEITTSSRSIAPGVNAGCFDAQYLRSVELANSRLSPDEMNACLDAAQRRRGWLVFTSHDVSASPSPFGCTPALLRAALEGAVARGFEIVTVAEALAQTEPAAVRSEHWSY